MNLPISLLFFWGCVNRQNPSGENDEGLNAFASDIVSEKIEDGNIIYAVKREFKLQDRVPAPDIEVACREGVVTLQGATNDPPEKRVGQMISSSKREGRSDIL
jgi:osmotically-inducible protein OsmY